MHGSFFYPCKGKEDSTISCGLPIAVNGRYAPFFLNPQELIVLGHPVGMAERACLNLTRIDS
jgi:hypothetical protein